MNYRIDLFSIFIFLGMAQGVLLLFFYVSGKNWKSLANRFHALMLLSLLACVLEIFLQYTGYIMYALHLVDFSETFSFLIGPSFYLLIVSLARGTVPKKFYLHFVFALLYLIAQIPFLILPEDAKYNAYVDAYRPDLPFREVDVPYDDKMFHFPISHSALTFISLGIYGFLALVELIRAFRQRKESFWHPQHPVLKTMRGGTIQILVAVAVILTVKLIYEHDYGDHLLAAYICITIYITSFSVMKDSGFFKQVPLPESVKYKSSTQTEEEQTQLLQRLQVLMETDRPFLRADFSLPDLAQRLNISVHTLSQTINEGLNKTFFELVADYRIAEAQKLLRAQPHIKIEEIAEQVGYLSKSSFNTAFKKITGLTPTEFKSKNT